MESTKVHIIERFEYTADNGLPAVCEVQFFDHLIGEGDNTEPRRTVVIIDCDTGPSVTNNIEGIATALRKRGYQWDTTVEHYRATSRRGDDEEFDWVDFEWIGDKAFYPDWHGTSRKTVEGYIGAKVV